jgi:predicted YcjX-like family ATPase
MGLELVDFPGERVADFLMAGRDYQAWSDLLLSHIQLDPAYGELAREFFAELAKASGDELRLLKAYKLFLGRALRRHYCRVVSPSHFLLDGYGHRPEAGGTPETWACERFCGRGPGEEFAPLSQEMRSRSPELTRRFAGHYREYRQKVVEPLLDWLADADQLLLFLDIPGILMGGPSMYNDELMVVQRVLELCERRGGSWRDIWQVGLVGWLLFRPSRIRRVGVVATKADLVATNRDVDHLENLAREMTYKRLRGLKLAGYEFFSCAAAASTKRSDNRRPSLTGRLVFDEAGRLLPRELSQPVEFAPSRVPERWPRDDEWGEFSFPEVYPQFSSRRDAPPRQEGLDRILRFILQ